MSTQEVVVSQSTSAVVIGGIPYRDRNPQTEAYFFSDFVNDVTPFCFCSGTQSTNTVNGLITHLTANLIDDRCGVAVVQLDTDASGSLLQGSRGGIYLSRLASAWSLDRTMNFGRNFDFMARVKVGASNASTFKMAIGFCETHGQPSSTIHLTNGPAFIIEGVGTIRTSVAVAQAETRVDTGVDPTSMHTYRIIGTVRTTEAGVKLNTFKFYLDGVLLRTDEDIEFDEAVAVLPTIEMRDRQTGGTAGTASFDVDYMSFKVDLTR